MREAMREVKAGLLVFLMGIMLGGGGVWLWLDKQHEGELSKLREAKEQLASEREVIREKVTLKQIEYKERVNEIISQDYRIVISNQVISWD